MWDIRYTFGPDTRPSPRWGIGVGAVNNYGSDILFPANITMALSREWNIGGKVNIQSIDKFDQVIVSLDVGGRYLINANNFVELDGNFGLNRNNSTAVVLTYGNEQFISKNFANFYELRDRPLGASFQGYRRPRASDRGRGCNRMYRCFG